MKDFTLAPDPLLVLLRPDSTFDERKAAAIRLAKDSWLVGWDACDEEYQKALQLAGLIFDGPPKARA